MQNIDGFDFFPLTFDDKGALKSRDPLDAMVERANTARATDALFIAHGFRNDLNDATTLYTHFLQGLRRHLSRPEFQEVAQRRFVVGGIYWPSKPFKETFDTGAAGTRGLDDGSRAMDDAREQLEDLKKHDATPAQRKKLQKAIDLLPALEGSPAKQDEFVKLVLSLLDGSKLDATEGMPQIRKRKGSELLARLDDAPAERSRGIGQMFGKVAGGVAQFLNLTTWYVMKDRSGAVGSTGVADAVRALHAARPDMRIHLVGHSLGGRLMAACAKALCTAPPLRPDSLTLLEAAFSHYGFSADNGKGSAGYFRDVVAKQIVKGPFVSTFSAQDTVVGRAYSVMSRLAGDDTREIGDAADEFGGIGRNGPLKTQEVANAPLHAAGKAYTFKPGVINNLDGSGGLIKEHGDVTNDDVTYAFASAVACT
jgi:hypothetical protein